MPLNRTLVVNAGSSSLKLRVLGPGDHLLAGEDLEGVQDPDRALTSFLGRVGEVDAIGHRVVHGGTEFTRPVELDSAVERRLKRLSELAPLHNPPAIAGIEAAMRLLPGVPNVACFDTAFHASLPPEASTYALPASWSQRWQLRRFGFHGLSHSYASRRAAELLDHPLAELCLVTAHLGAGASLTAVKGGRSIDTTMGFTPLDGLVMATRSGAVDPGLLLWVQAEAGLDPDGVERALDREAGLLGISGRSGDMREILEGIGEGDGCCQLAFDVYCHRLAGSVAAMAASMGGIDALAFTGGVGEGSPQVRSAACNRLGFLGLAIETGVNAAAEGDTILTAAGAAVGAVVVRAREDLEIAAGVRAVLCS